MINKLKYLLAVYILMFFIPHLYQKNLKLCISNHIN